MSESSASCDGLRSGGLAATEVDDRGGGGATDEAVGDGATG